MSIVGMFLALKDLPEACLVKLPVGAVLMSSPMELPQQTDADESIGFKG